MGDGGSTAGADLVDDSAAQLANEAIDGAFNERMQQLPEQRCIRERLQPPRSSISGSSKPSSTGARSSAHSGRCNGSAGRNCSVHCLIPDAVNASGKECSGWSRLRSGKQVCVQNH